MSSKQNNVVRVAQMLEEASKLLLDETSSSSSSSSSTGEVNPLQRTLQRASSMLQESSSSGLYRRLNRTERLRAAVNTTPVRGRGRSRQQNCDNNMPAKKPHKEATSKPLEFALLRCFEEDDEPPHYIKWDSVLANGIVMLGEQDSEERIREVIRDSLKSQYPMIGVNDFLFIKLRHKLITTMHVAPGTEYCYPVVKKMAGQGLLYLQVKPGFEFIYATPSTEEDEHHNTDDDTEGNKATPTTECRHVAESEEAPWILTESTSAGPSLHEQPVSAPTNIPRSDPIKNTLTLSRVIELLIEEIKVKAMNDPVEILRFLQNKLVKGRSLDVEATDIDLEGETNYICIDRSDVLTTTFSELEGIENYLIAFEVDFMGEMAKDFGGPRKEWIRLVNIAIKERLFDRGLREYLNKEYYFVGIMIAVALLQSGQLPTYLPSDILEHLLDPTEDLCMKGLQNGLDAVGMLKIFKAVPILMHLLVPTDVKLNVKMLLQLLAPVFSPEGSSAMSREKEVYKHFVKYAREVASGRREPVFLSSILSFVTGASEEPVLGFTLHPSISFAAGEPDDKGNISEFQYTPTSHTCSNTLVLPRDPLIAKLPTEERLFELYDYAFTNTYFGTM